jgi:hypothetical protein
VILTLHFFQNWLISETHISEKQHIGLRLRDGPSTHWGWAYKGLMGRQLLSNLVLKTSFISQRRAVGKKGAGSLGCIGS